MNAYPDYIDFFKDVAARLQLLGQEAGKVNLFFVDTPEQANVLLVGIRSKLTLPCLLIEYYDEDVSDGAGKFTELTGALVVLQQSKKKTTGHNDTREAIYVDAKPAADQILAHMQKLSNTGKLKVDGKPTTISPDIKGLWVGPLHNDLYGWRYEFTWRIAAASCFNPDHWKPN